MQVKVTRVSKKNTDANGQYLKNSRGQTYWKIGIQVDGQEGWLSGFADNERDPMYNIEEGKEYSITVTEKELNGKIYKNFKLLSAKDMQIEDLVRRVVALENYCFGVGKKPQDEAVSEKHAQSLDDF